MLEADSTESFLRELQLQMEATKEVFLQKKKLLDGDGELETGDTVSVSAAPLTLIGSDSEEPADEVEVKQ